MQNTKYVKIAFRSREGTTAGLVVPFERYKNSSISDLSRLFPYSEARLMREFLVSPQFDSFEAAFAHQWEATP